MPQIKVGLAQGKTSFYDKKTNTYITLNNPVQAINFDANTDLSGICHALLASVPALKLYEGDLPQVTIDAWKERYNKLMHSPTGKNLVINGKVVQTLPITSKESGAIIEPNSAGDRADRLNAESANPVAAVSEGEAEEVELEGASVEAEEVEVKEVEEVKEEENKSTRKGKKANK